MPTRVFLVLALAISITPTLLLPSPGTRLRTAFDFGLVTLDIVSLRGDDSGIYTCRAVNLMGEAVSTCTLKVEGKTFRELSLYCQVLC